MSCCLEDQKPQLAKPPPEPPAGAFLLAHLKAGLADGGSEWLRSDGTDPKSLYLVDHAW
jgi:hypothetical protein